jgi:hypothetical protein
MTVAVQDEGRFRRWVRNPLQMTLDELTRVTPEVPEDAYVVWLRPTPDDPDHLYVYEGANLSSAQAEHHLFGRNDGLAGTVWAKGAPGAHSPSAPHSAWRPRVGCVNETWAGVPVGEPGGPGGVLGFGSDTGFQVSGEQIAVLVAFASLLAIACPSLPPSGGGCASRR